MADILKDVIYLTIIGGIVTIILLVLMAVFKKKISGRIQKVLWILALLSMFLPVWKFIPKDSVKPILLPYSDYITTTEITLDEPINWAPVEITGEGVNPSNELVKFKINNMDRLVKVVFYAWVFGVVIYVGITLIGYFVFLFRKKHNSIKLLENTIFQEIKQALNIKRKIRMRECKDSDSPFLTGIIYPIIYLPEEKGNEEAQKMIYLHELTHYKHKDLLLKWIAFFINAVHWFNPLSYVIVKNINKACELHCDMSVTKQMTDEDKTAYMNTIVNLVAKE